MTHVADAINSLQGKEAGRHCLIIGGGPSAKGAWGWPVRDCEWDFTIVINGAFQLLRDAPGGPTTPNYWVQLDYDNPKPPWFEEGYVYCTGGTVILSHVLRESHPDAIHCKVSTDEPELRSARLGLKMCDAETGTRLVGTSALCALHLCGILGASKVSMIGCELAFAGERGEIHHPYSCRNYGAHPTTSGAEMEPTWYPQYERWSCPWFVASARRVKEYMQFAAANGMECTDYSGGLLGLV